MTLQEARDAMLGVFKTYWDTTGFTALYPDVPGAVPTTDVVWARATIKHALRRQSSLTGGLGQIKYENQGILIIQVFAPIGEGSKRAYQYGMNVVHAYEDARLDVWFRNVHLNEVGNSGAFEQVNVVADFNYDEVR